MKLATAGCLRNCSEAMVKDIGVAGAHVRKGDVLATVVRQAEVLRVMGRFIQCYRENEKYLERTYSFVERLGIQKLRSLLMEDSEEMVNRLDWAIE